jgi:pyruvate kinase
MGLRRAKIVCTLGPAVDSADATAGLIEAGMNVARLNFSHGTHAEHAARVARVREASARLGRHVAILQDLGGPKIRTGPDGPPQLETGSEVDLVPPSFRGADANTLVIGHERLAEDVRVGDRILLADGQVQLSVLSIDGGRVRAKVEHGGRLRPRMGVNLPSHRLSVRALSDKDRADLRHGLAIGVDYVALSFVRDAAELEELRALCHAEGRPTLVVAKIETPAAVEHLEAIVDAADAIMVARGDLGVELLPERVPVVQKQILDACRTRKKPAIVATQMLESMVNSPLPTRAEASDVAGAVFGGADALMLSAETATGAYPIQACKMMDRVIRAAETSVFFEPFAAPVGRTPPEAIARAACELADRVGARLIVALTTSGGTARLLSKARPKTPIAAFSPESRTLTELALLWGVVPHSLPIVSDLEELLERARAYLSGKGLLASGDPFVLVYGAPLGARGSTNAVRVELA